MKISNTQVTEFIQFCKFILAYSAVLTTLNVILLSKNFDLKLVLMCTIPALISYFGFKFLASK